jgi:PAS domain S-box-containing protein
MPNSIETLHRIIVEKLAASGGQEGDTQLSNPQVMLNDVSHEFAELNTLLQHSGGALMLDTAYLNQCLVSTSNRLLHVIQNLDYGICVCDEHNNIVFVNQRFCNFFGAGIEPISVIGTACGLLSTDVLNLFSNPEAFKARHSELLNQREPVRGDNVQLVSGTKLRRDYLPILNKTNFLGHVWIFEDITQEIADQAELARQRLFYEDVLNKIPSDLAVFNNKREYMFVNQLAVKDPAMRQWLIGKRDEDYFQCRQHPEDVLHKRVATIEDVMKTGEQRKWEETFTLKDGTIKHHLRYMYPVLDDEQKVKLLIGYGMDITDQKRIEEQIQRSEKRYRDLFNYSEALICTHDLEGRLTSVNPAICRLLEYTEDEMTGRLISDFIPAEHLEGFINSYLAPLKRDGKCKGVFCVISKSGQRIFLLYKNYKVEEAATDAYVIGFSQDITDRVEAEKELLLAKKNTEDTAHAKEIFLANMSHEIRTPMNGVLGFANLLVKTDLNEQQKGYLKMIQESANNLLAIVNDVLDLEKIQMGKLKFEHIDFPMAERLEMCVQTFTYKAEEKGIALSSMINLDPDLAVIGDPYRLSQLLNNLLSNAIKFTEEGSVTVKAAVHESTDALLRIEFSVTDTGIGIPADKHKEIFQPFVQANTAVTRQYGGTGLGLSICNELIEMMGGELFLESEPGKGSTFRFILPFGISVSKPKHKDMSQEINYRSLGNRRILVAEDVELNQYLAKHIMESWGFEVDIAVNGREALNKVQLKPYDLVLMDIQMPEMDGMEATQHIRALDDKLIAGIPIVALTANALKGDSEKYMAVGMNDYLSKPFDEPRLFLVISKNLEAKAARDAADLANATNVNQLNNATSNAGPDTSAAAVDNFAVTSAAVNGNDADEKLYNLSMVESISGGDAEFVKRMIQLFLDTIPPALNDIRAARDEQRWDALGKLAHKLKSTIDSMGIVQLKQIVRTIEANGKNGDNLEETSLLVDQLLAVMEACIRQIKKDFSL